MFSTGDKSLKNMSMNKHKASELNNSREQQSADMKYFTSLHGSHSKMYVSDFKDKL
jgi:hypothetical protein